MKKYPISLGTIILNSQLLHSPLFSLTLTVLGHIPLFTVLPNMHEIFNILYILASKIDSFSSTEWDLKQENEFATKNVAKVGPYSK